MSESAVKEDTRRDGGASTSHEEHSKPQKRSASATVKTTKRKAVTAGKQPPGSASKRKKADVTPGKQRTIASFFTTAASSKPADVDRKPAPGGSLPSGKEGDQASDVQVGLASEQPGDEADRAAQATQAAGSQGDEAVVTLVDEDEEGGGEAGAEVKAEPDQEPGPPPQELKTEPDQEPGAPQKLTRQLGAFATASVPPIGVANALIEKRRAGQRKAAGDPQNGAAEAVKRESEEAVTWQEGTPAPYLVIARAFAAMESTTKRLAKDNIMVEMFRGILRCSPGVHTHYPFYALWPP